MHINVAEVRIPRLNSPHQGPRNSAFKGARWEVLGLNWNTRWPIVSKFSVVSSNHCYPCINTDEDCNCNYISVPKILGMSRWTPLKVDAMYITCLISLHYKHLKQWINSIYDYRIFNFFPSKTARYSRSLKFHFIWNSILVIIFFPFVKLE